MPQNSISEWIEQKGLLVGFNLEEGSTGAVLLIHKSTNSKD